MFRYVFLLLFLICFTNTLAQQKIAIPTDSLLIKQFKQALSIRNLEKRDLKVDELFQLASKNGALFTLNIYNFSNDANLKEKWISYCGKVVDKLIEEQGINTAIDFVSDLSSEQLPVAELERYLILKIQEFPNETNHLEILIQIYILNHQYEKAWLQRRSLDIRLKQGGLQLAEFGQLLFQLQEWELANRVFDYIIKIYPNAVKISRWKQLALMCKEQLIFSQSSIELSSIKNLIHSYRLFRKEWAAQSIAQETYLKEAKLWAYQLNEMDSAIVLLQNALPNIQSDALQAQLKMDLADYLSFQGKKYDALILISQVEKQVKDSPLSYEAKFKKAKIYYYTGDFELAKELLDILKESSQREISNDALNLRWVIEDNTGMDSLETNLKAFSKIQWLFEQKKFSAGDLALSEFSQNSQKSSLEDDVLFLQAKRQMELKNEDQAKKLFYDLFERFPQDIYADDALYYYLKLSQFRDKNACQKFIESYPTSLFQVDVRNQLLIP